MREGLQDLAQRAARRFIGQSSAGVERRIRLAEVERRAGDE